MAVLQQDPVPIRDRNPELPAWLADVIDGALIDEPHIAMTSATELSRALIDAT
jgi:hypothetical protein